MFNFFKIASSVLAGLTFTLFTLTAGAADKYTKFEDVEALNDQFAALEGKKVSVSGEVEYRVDERTFVLESGGLLDDEVVVVLPKDFSKAQAPLILDDAELVVKGTVRNFQVVEFEREIEWDWDVEVEADLEGVTTVIVADSVSKK